MNEEYNTQPSCVDILLRYAASEEEMRAIIDVLQLWTHSDPRSFPAQLAVITLTQWRAAATVPMEMERLLQVYRDEICAICENVDAAVAVRLEAVASTQATFEEATGKMTSSVAHLYKIAYRAEQHLSQSISASEAFYREAHQELSNKVYNRTTMLMFWSLACGLLFAVGFVMLMWR